MDLGKGPRQPSMVVKKVNERAGTKLSRTKYFIRIGETNMMPEIKEPINLPDGGFIVPMHVDHGNSDFLRPQLPSPGDIRRMFGNDKIDCEPEYARGVDPDWSRVSPTTPAELENNIREWNAATSTVLRKYRDIEEKRRRYDKKIKFSEVSKRTRSEDKKGKNSKSREQRLNTAGAHKLRRKDSKNKRRGAGYSTASTTTSDSSKMARSKNQPNKNSSQEISSSDTLEVDHQRITYSPERIKLKSYNTAISVVQKMSSDHWIMIDKLYTDIKREKGIIFESLNEQVMTIIRDIYGIESEFILSTIHSDPVQRVVKLGKIMLNVYHEAMFESPKNKKPKLLVPGLNNHHFAQKCIQAYTFNPHYRRSAMTSKMYARLTASRAKPPKCIACYKENMERQNALKKNVVSNLSTKNNNQVKRPNNNKSYIKEPKRFNRRNKTKSSKSSVSDSCERRKEMISNGILKKSNHQKSQMMFYIPPFLAEEQYEKPAHDLPPIHTSESNLTVSSNREECSSIEIEVPPEMFMEKVENRTEEYETKNSNTGKLGGGDSLVQFSNDYNYLLSTLYESSSSVSIEMSKTLSASPAMDNFRVSPERQKTDRFFTSTANILQLNDQLEKMLLAQTYEYSSRSFQEAKFSDSESEKYIDCDVAEDQDSKILMTEKTNVQKNYYKYSKWICINNCIGHRGYITFFITIILGLITAIFCNDSFLNRVKDDTTLKDSVKQVVKTFLLGALRLVDGF